MFTVGRLFLVALALYLVVPTEQVNMKTLTRLFSISSKTTEQKDMIAHVKRLCTMLLKCDIRPKVDREEMNECKISMDQLVKKVGYDHVDTSMEMFLGTRTDMETVESVIKKYRNEGWDIEDIKNLKYNIRGSPNRERLFIFNNASFYESKKWWQNLLKEKDGFASPKEMVAVLEHQRLKRTVPLYHAWKASHTEITCYGSRAMRVLLFDDLRDGDLEKNNEFNNFFDLVCKQLYDYDKQWTDTSLEFMLFNDHNAYDSKRLPLDDIKLILEHFPYIGSALANRYTSTYVRHKWDLKLMLSMVRPRLRPNGRGGEQLRPLISGMRGAIMMDMNVRVFALVVQRGEETRGVGEEAALKTLHALHLTEIKVAYEYEEEGPAVDFVFAVHRLDRKVREKVRPAAADDYELQPLTMEIVKECINRQFPFTDVTRLVDGYETTRLAEKDITTMLKALEDEKDMERILKVLKLFDSLNLLDWRRGRRPVSLWEATLEHNKQWPKKEVKLYTFVELHEIVGKDEAVRAYFEGGTVTFCERPVVLAIGQYFAKFEYDERQYREQVRQSCEVLGEFMSVEARVKFYTSDLAREKELDRAFTEINNPAAGDAD